MTEEEILLHLDRDNLPAHVAIIMDGNGRWARLRGLPRIAGHREGIASVRDAVTLCRELGIQVLTIYAFSAENWKRPELEVNTLMAFLEEYLQRELKTMMEKEIRFRTIGQTQRLPSSVRRWIDKVVHETESNRAMTLNIALSYGGRAEIVDAVKQIVREAEEGRLSPDALDEALFSRYLYTAGLPDPDLMIRTSGEARISNFLLYQMAYTELYFTKTLWPDFRRRELLQAILNYQQRERRFGMVETGVTESPGRRN
ncbi:MAG: isoprenyl transferase [Nitrospirae bacterium]|nr:isoprenyl transferase [Nitrospirota bacterium]